MCHHRRSKNREFDTCVCGVYRRMGGPKRIGTWDTVYDRFEVTVFCNVTPSVISRTFADVCGGFSPINDPHVCPVSARPHIGLISVKFYIGDLCVNLWKCKFGYNQAKISVTLHEDRSAHYYFRRHKLAIKGFLFSTQFFPIADSDISIHNTLLRFHRNIGDANACLRGVI